MPSQPFRKLCCGSSKSFNFYSSMPFDYEMNSSYIFFNCLLILIKEEYVSREIHSSFFLHSLIPRISHSLLLYFIEKATYAPNFVLELNIWRKLVEYDFTKVKNRENGNKFVGTVKKMLKFWKKWEHAFFLFIHTFQRCMGMKRFKVEVTRKVFFFFFLKI